ILRRSSRDALSITNNVFPSVRKPTPYTHHLTRSLVGVELEIDCPDRVRLGRCQRVDGRETNAFAAPTPRDPQTLLPPEPLDLLMIDNPASPRAPVIHAPVPPRGLLCVPPKPITQRSIRNHHHLGLAPPSIHHTSPPHRSSLNHHRVGLEQASIRESAQPHQATRHPLAHQQRPDQMSHASTASARAQKSPSPNSFKTVFSNSASASNRFSMAFYFSSSFNRFASSALRAPY